MTKLELHCDLAYLEYVLQRVIKEHINLFIQKTINIAHLYFKESQIRCCFVENNEGTYDLHIWSKLYVNYDFGLFIREYCGLNKTGCSCYNNVEVASNSNYGFLDDNKEYTKQLIFYNFTEDEIFGLIAFFKISQYSGIDYKEVIHYLAVCSPSDYNFNKLFLPASKWDGWDSGLIFRNNFYDMIIYTVTEIDAYYAHDWLKSKCWDMKDHMSPVVRTGCTVTKFVPVEYKYNWLFRVNLNEKEYLGLCHILLGLKKITGRLEYE